MNRLQALVGLNLAGDIGSIRLRALLGYFKNIEDIFTSSQKELNAVSGVGQKIAARITSIKKEEIDREYALAHKLGLRIICEEDADYPFNLKNIPDPPIVLYVKGDFAAEDKFSLFKEQYISAQAPGQVHP